MEVILNKNILGVGEEGDIVKVKRGFARNYLLPKQLCVLKTPNNLRVLEKHQEIIKARKQTILDESLKLKDKINGLSLEFEKKVVEGNKIYGSVTSKDIVEILEKNEISVTKQNIELPGHIKMIGNYTIPIRLFSGDKAELKLIVKALED